MCEYTYYYYFLSFVCFVAKHLTAHCLIIRLLCTLLLFKILMIVSITMAHWLNWNKVSREIFFFWADKCENSPLASSTFIILDNKRQTIQVTVSEIYFSSIGGILILHSVMHCLRWLRFCKRCVPGGLRKARYGIYLPDGGLKPSPSPFPICQIQQCDQSAFPFNYDAAFNSSTIIYGGARQIWKRWEKYQTEAFLGESLIEKRA